MTKRKRYRLRKPVSNVINRSLICIVIFMFLLIINKFDHNFISDIKRNIFNKSFNFIKVNSLTRNILGKEFIYYQDENNSLQVINDDLYSEEVHKYYDGEKFKVSDNLPIGTFESGVVIFIGDKDNYKNTVIVQGTDGFNIWYGNIKDVNVSLYDYVEKNSLLGNSDGEEVYILIEKNNHYYSYEDYKKSKN